jgi:hypothetical protein
MAGTVATQGQGGITHKGWRTDMETSATLINTILHELEIIKAALAKVEAGQTQRTLVNRDIAVGSGLKTWAEQFVGATNKRYVPVGEEVARAGGIKEVALDKRYHVIDG